MSPPFNAVDAERPAVAPITMRVPEACRFIGLSRSTLYVLVATGEIETVKVGAVTLVLTESLCDFINRRRNVPA